MIGIMSLWLPILLSSIIVFILSSIIHMVMPWHKNDYPRLSNEDKVMDALRPLSIPPGDYMLPRPATREDMHSAEFKTKLEKGPVLVMTVWPNGMRSMTNNLIQWFVYLVIVGIFCAYLASRTLPIGTAYLSVFRLVGTVAFLGYSAALWQMSIWYGRSWKVTAIWSMDGLIYGLFTAGTFGWLWPR